MFSKIKGAFLSSIDIDPVVLKQKYKYSRPVFIGLESDDELQVSSDTIIRPILVPRDLNKLKWNSGYAEVINAGKSARNEDQAAIYSSTLRIRFNKKTILHKLMDMDPFLHHLFAKNMKPTTLPRMRSEDSNRLRVDTTLDNNTAINKSETNDEPKSLPLIAENASVLSNNSSNNSINQPLLPDDLLSPSIPINPNHFDSSASSSTINSNQSTNLNRSRSFKEISSNSSRSNLEKSQSFSSFLNSNCSKDEELKESSLPFHLFLIFDGHAGSDVSVACSHQLHNIIAYKLQSIADLLIEFGIDSPINQRTERQRVEDNRTLHTNRVKYNKNHLNTTSQPSLFDYALNDSANLFNFMNKVESNINGHLNGDLTEEINETADDNNSSNNSTSNNSSSNNTSSNNSSSNNLTSNNLNNNQQSDPQTPFSSFNYKPSRKKLITVDSLIIGALESAFFEMDQIIANDKKNYKMSGGCTCLVALFILGKLYVSNAGDSRGIIVKDNQVIPMSFDFTPESERERVQYLGLLKPELLGNEFTALEFIIGRPTRRDLGKKILCRDGFMSGWTYKVVTNDDLKYPLVFGEGKRSRVLATIGVTRGFGDHELRAQGSEVFIKPFLTPEPEVRIINLEKDDTLNEDDVLIMATDGLFDIVSNEKVAEICYKTFQQFPLDSNENADKENKSNQLNFKYRYISLAQDLVCYARGKSKNNNGKNWKTACDKPATIDDITVFVIPLKNYRDEYREWKRSRNKQATNSKIVNDKN